MISRENYLNLCYLRDVVIPWMRANPERVNFGTYGKNRVEREEPCCLGGWYVRMRGLIEDPRDAIEILAAHFGPRMHICRPGEVYIWSAVSEITLDRRAEQVDIFIAEYEQAHAAAPELTVA